MSDVTAPQNAVTVAQSYHERTKHRLNGYAAGPDTLDWDAQPDPFRRYTGAALTAIVTRESAENLGLVNDRDVLAFVKASSILLLTGDDGHISARNRFTGTVTHLHQGPVNAEVTLSMPGGQHVLTVVVTDDSVKRLGLDVGQRVTAVFKASCVFLASID